MVDFPAGVNDYTVSIKFQFTWETLSWAVFGAAASGADLLIRTREVALPEVETLIPFSTSLAPVAWNTGASAGGAGTLTIPLNRSTLGGSTSAAGPVRVKVGVSVHAEPYAVAGESDAMADVFVQEICIQGTG